MLTLGKDGQGFRLHIDAATICFSTLTISATSNTSLPHCIIGHGDARIMLTDEQLIVLLAEYLRYTIQSTIEVDREQVGYKFFCQKEMKDA